MKCFFRLTNFLQLLAVAAVGTALSNGAVIYDSGVTALTSSDPIQEGRINRTGVPSNWSSAKVFPGILNPSFGYAYDTYAVTNVLFPYIQITFDDVSGSALTFASAYLGSYDPNVKAANNGLDINYLGDAGSSGNYFGTDPIAFQVVVPVHDTLLVVVNGTGTAANPAVGQPYRILVEGFTDTSFDDAIPEPASMGLTAVTLLAAAILVLVRRKKSNGS